MPTFNCFSTGNAYLTPYSSAKDGGELVSEFNLRAALNVIGWKHVDLTEFNPTWEYDSWMTGSKSASDLSLSIAGSSLRVAPGEALIAAYYGDFMQEMLIPTSDSIPVSEFPANSPDDATITKLVKLGIATTQSPNNRHDQRLVPPMADLYLGVELIIDDVVPTSTQLFLGTLTRHIDGSFTVWNNPDKSRTISIEHVSGAGNYTNLVEAPVNDGSIYGVQRDEEGNLINIDEWTWLAYSSPLGRYLRNMAKVADDAGSPGVPGVSEMLHMIIGRSDDAAVLRIIDATNPVLEYRVLRDSNQSPDAYALEQVQLPFASYDGHAPHSFPDTVPLISQGTAGIVDPRTLAQVDSLWADRDSFQAGRQFGPFESTADAFGATTGLNMIKTRMRTIHGPTWDFQKNDYFWVLNDSLEETPGDLNTILQTSFGTVAGNYDAVTTANITVPITGAATVDINVPITGVIAGSVTGTVTGNTLPAPGDAFTGDITGGAVTGVLNTQAAGQAAAAVEGTGTGLARGTGSGRFTGTLNSFTQNVSTRYVYLPDMTTYDPEDAEHDMIWVRQSVLRGFATPATPQSYGFVKPSSGAAMGDVVLDPSSNQLKLRPEDITMLQLAGWKLHNGGAITLQSTSISDIQSLEGTWFLKPVTIALIGDGWDANTIPQLRRLKGDITLDISASVDPSVDGVLPIIKVVEVSTLKLVVGISTSQISVEDCTLQPSNFNSIHEWVSSRFTSGSNTAVLDNPWMLVDKVFSNTYDNSLQVRFVSVTRGRYEIESAEMDIWVKRAKFDKAVAEGDDTLLLTSMQTLKFPPFVLRLDESGNVIERQDIPTNLNLKVAGSAGKHRVWADKTSPTYTISGNWLSTIDWESGQHFALNARMVNLSKNPHHGFFDVRFRALVQFTQVDDMAIKSIKYTDVY